MKRTTFLAAAFALAAGMAFAQDATQVLVDQFKADGYTRIEVKTGSTLTKIEAIRDGQKVEVVVDNATGEVIKRETQAVEPGEDTSPGVFVDDKGADDSADTDEDGDDSGDDGSDSGSDDDGGDDDSDSGSDDNGGGDDSGSDGDDD